MWKKIRFREEVSPMRLQAKNAIHGRRTQKDSKAKRRYDCNKYNVTVNLEFANAMTKEAFVRLAIEWNQGSPHVENRIQGVNWNGEYNVRYGTEHLWLAIEEYRNKNTVAIRY